MNQVDIDKIVKEHKAKALPPPPATTTVTKTAPPPKPEVTFNEDEQKDIAGLVSILSFKREAESNTEWYFCDEFFKTMPAAKADAYGNYWLEILKPDGSRSEVLWSCHTDTVHRNKEVITDGKFQIQKQEIGITKSGYLCLMDTKNFNDCLGADDGAGLWLMSRMVKSLVPGLYIFHRDEEVGARGSKWIATHRKEDLAHIKYAIAFDRKGTKDIITKQGGIRTASDEFALSMAKMLPPGYVPDPTGSFTDTKSYKDFIPECTNISCGYHTNHCSSETLDIKHIIAMRNYLIKFDESLLVCKRDPNEVEPTWRSNNGYYSNRYTGASAQQGWGSWEDDLPPQYGSWKEYYEALNQGKAYKAPPQKDPASMTEKEKAAARKKELDLAYMADIVARDPDAVAMLLMSYGYKVDTLEKDLAEYDAKGL